jgi:hypothetical protein
LFVSEAELVLYEWNGRAVNIKRAEGRIIPGGFQKLKLELHEQQYLS